MNSWGGGNSWLRRPFRSDRKSRRCSTHAQMMAKLRARFASEPAQPCASDRAESQRATPRRGREARAMGYVAL